MELSQKDKEKFYPILIKDLKWQLTFEGIDWEHFIDTAKLAQALQKGGLK